MEVIKDKHTISLSEPTLGKEEIEALCAVINSGWLTMGAQVAALERAFARLHRVDNAVAVNSCTAGLHLILTALNIGPGDEVLVPAMTFVATANAILYCGAKPIFVDIISSDLPHLSIIDAEKKCTPRTKAVIVMHYGGYLVDLPAWRSFADAHQLMLIEDAAHAPGIEEVGCWGDAAAFSFFTNKNMTTAEGGMVLAQNDGVLERIRHLRSHGMTTSTLDRHRGHAYSYDVTLLGYNYRLDELRAALGNKQLTHLLQWNNRRRELSQYYREVLTVQVPEISITFEPTHPTAAHLMPILLTDSMNRESIMSKLYQAGIQSSIHYPPIHQFSYYRERYPDIKLPNTEKFFSRELTLPLHPRLSKNDVITVVEALRGAITKR